MYPDRLNRDAYQGISVSSIVMERIHGIPVTNISALKQSNINLRRLAERGVEIFFTQVFRDRFFHADMHPGNIFVSPDHPDNPKYIAVDFGIMGTLNAEDQRYLAENILAFLRRDYYRVAELHVHSGWVAPTTRIEEFEAAIRRVSEPMFERPLKGISCGQMLLQLFQIGRRFDMHIQPQLIMLQKTLLAVEGLGRQLYPDLDLWSTAKPFLERWLTQRFSTKNLVKTLQNNAPYWLEKLPEVPELFFDTLKYFQTQGRQNNHVQMLQRAGATGRTPSKWRQFLMGAGAALIVTAGSSLFAMHHVLPEVSTLHYMAMVFGVGGIAAVLAAVVM